MKSKANPPFSLDPHHGQNWDVEARPVAILNEASTLHERVSHCWSLAFDLLETCDLFNEGQPTDTKRFAGLLHGRLKPLVDLLDLIGTDTHQASLASSKAIRQGAGNE